MFDEDDFGGDTGAGGGIFPFLSVLISTIGVMAFILVTGSLKMTLAGSPKKGQVERKHADVSKVRQQLTTTRDTLTTRKEEVLGAADVTADLAEQTDGFLINAREVSSDIQEKTVAVQEMTGKVKQIEEQKEAFVLEGKKYGNLKEQLTQKKELDEAEAAYTKAKKELDDAQEKATTLQGEAIEAEKVRDKLRIMSQDPKVTFLLSGRGADANPVVLEVKKDLITVVRSTVDGYAPGTTNKAPRDRKVAEYFDDLASKVVRATPRTFTLLLVKPDGEETFLEARKAFQKWGAAFAYEPIEEKWSLGGFKKDAE